MRALLLILIAAMATDSLMADIQEAKPSKSFKELNIGPKAKKRAKVLQVPLVDVEVFRGQSVMIPIEAQPEEMGNLSVRILDPPRHGKLSKADSLSGSAACFLYRHDGNAGASEDGFTFVVKSPLFGSAVRQKARIVIRKPEAEISVDPAGPIDFGKIPLGSNSVREVRITNSFGCTLEGSLSVSTPWRIDGDSWLRLEEGEGRVIRLVFEPANPSRETSRLMIDSAIESLPEITLTGEGTQPFVLVGAGRLFVEKAHPKASLCLSNTLDTPMTVTVSGLPRGISAPARVDLPPLGSSGWTLAMDSSLTAPEMERKYPITFTTEVGGGHPYCRTVDLVLRGPRASPTLELLRGGGQSGCKVGEVLRLEGIARNPSAEEWSVDLRIGALKGAAPLSSRLVIPSGGMVNFHHDWSSRAEGDDKVMVELRDPDGRLLTRDSWTVSAAGILGAVPQGEESGTTQGSIPKPALPAVSPENKRFVDGWGIADNLVVDLKPILLKGWFFDRAALSWRYLGGGMPRFRIQTQRGRNALADRTGEQSERQWVDLKGIVPVDLGKGLWRAELPILLPGSHQLRVFPSAGTEILVSTLTMEISARMVFWPPFRALFFLLIALLALKVIRRRFS